MPAVHTPASIKVTTRAIGELEDPEEMKMAMAMSFQEAQKSVALHKRQTVILKAIQQRAHDLGISEVFNLSFCKFINKILPLKKGDNSGDRITKFISHFVSAIDSELENENEEEIDEAKDEMFKEFFDKLARHLMRGFEAQNRNVRYRVCYLLSNIMSNLGSIDDDLYQSLSDHLLTRLYDKEAIVRLKAAVTLASFQDDDTDDQNVTEMSEAASKLIYLLQNDSSSDVRKVALQYIERNKFTKPIIFQRARDVNNNNRRYVYSHVLPAIGDFRTIDFDTRDKLLLWGLRDRDDKVREAAGNWISKTWMKDLNGDVLELVERLKPMTSEIAETALNVFLTSRKDVVNKIHFNKDAWSSLTPESSFLLRAFYQYCNENNMATELETNFPEAAVLADLISKNFNERKENLSVIESRSSDEIKDPKEIDFILGQLLKISVDYDYSDDFGRRQMLNVLRSALNNDNLPDVLIEVALKVIRKLSISERDFSQIISEIVTDLRDNAIESLTPAKENTKTGEGDSDEDDEDDDDDDEDEEEFHSALNGDDPEALANLSRLSAIRKANKSIDQELNAIRSLKSEDIMQCLNITHRMLQLIYEPLSNNFPVISLIDSLIQPSLNREEVALKELAGQCLGLCCMLDKALAKNHLFTFGVFVTKSEDETLMTLGIKVITDILAVHGPSIFEFETERHVDALAILKLFSRTLGDSSRKGVQATSVEALYKLFLTGSIADLELLEVSLMAYFKPENNDNEALKQCLSFCIPVYALSHVLHQESIVRITSDLLVRIIFRWEEMTEVAKANGTQMIKFSTVVEQLLFWTDPYRIANRDFEDATKSSIQIDLALQFLDAIRNAEYEEFKRPLFKTLVINLTKTTFTEFAEFAKLKLLKKTLDFIIAVYEVDDVESFEMDVWYDKFDPIGEDESDSDKVASRNEFKEKFTMIFQDKPARNAFKRFQLYVDDCYEKAKESNEIGEDVDIEDDDIVVPIANSSKADITSRANTSIGEAVGHSSFNNSGKEDIFDFDEEGHSTAADVLNGLDKIKEEPKSEPEYESDLNIMKEDSFTSTTPQKKSSRDTIATIKKEPAVRTSPRNKKVKALETKLKSEPKEPSTKITKKKNKKSKEVKQVAKEEVTLYEDDDTTEVKPNKKSKKSRVPPSDVILLSDDSAFESSPRTRSRVKNLSSDFDILDSPKYVPEKRKTQKSKSIESLDTPVKATRRSGRMVTTPIKMTR